MKADREQYQPREEGTLSITARDADGKPVAAEIALALIDESVNYIQQDYAGDPRQFYYGSKRGQGVTTQSTFNQKSYTQLVLITSGQLVDIKEAGQYDDREDRPSGTLSALKDSGARRGNVAGNTVDGVSSTDRFSNAPMAARAVTESPVMGRDSNEMAMLKGHCRSCHLPARNQPCRCAAIFAQPSSGNRMSRRMPMAWLVKSSIGFAHYWQRRARGNNGKSVRHRQHIDPYQAAADSSASRRRVSS